MIQTLPNVQKEDLVLVVGSMQHRSKWLLGRIIKTFPEPKGRVRAVLVKTKHGTAKRPIARLYIVGDQKDLDPPMLIRHP